MNELTSYRVNNFHQQMIDANPRYAVATQTGDILTPEEAAFIHFYLATGDGGEAYKMSGLPYPIKPLSHKQKLKLIKAGNIDTVLTYNSQYYTMDDEEKKMLEMARAGDIDAVQEYACETNYQKNLRYKRQVNKYNAMKRQISKMSEEQQLAKYNEAAQILLKLPYIAREVKYRLSKINDAMTADASEVLRYFTAVMRGQVKDQFGIEASLQERTRAAEALAKRLIDIPQKLNTSKAGVGTVQITIEPRAALEECVGEYEYIEEDYEEEIQE